MAGYFESPRPLVEVVGCLLLCSQRGVLPASSSSPSLYSPSCHLSASDFEGGSLPQKGRAPCLPFCLPGARSLRPGSFWSQPSSSPKPLPPLPPGLNPFPGREGVSEPCASSPGPPCSESGRGAERHRPCKLLGDPEPLCPRRRCPPVWADHPLLPPRPCPRLASGST